jgi:hypothetical protein
MKRFMLLRYGFETPTPEIMEAWGKWFEAVADKTVGRVQEKKRWAEFECGQQQFMRGPKGG